MIHEVSEKYIRGYIFFLTSISKLTIQEVSPMEKFSCESLNFDSEIVTTIQTNTLK